MDIPKNNTISMIDQALKHKVNNRVKRTYMGTSYIGHECARRVWYHYHKPDLQEAIGPRIQRIFDMGHMIEDYLVKMLVSTGLEVHEKDSNGDQFGFEDGPVRGHIDGVIKNIPESTKAHLLEIKSANNKNFNSMVKKGIRNVYEHYWVQAQIYAYKMKLDKILFIVYNKDNSELYQERMDVNKKAAKAYLKRAKDLAIEELEPPREYRNESFYKCKFCPFNKECWK